MITDEGGQPVGGVRIEIVEKNHETVNDPHPSPILSDETGTYEYTFLDGISWDYYLLSGDVVLTYYVGHIKLKYSKENFQDQYQDFEFNENDLIKEYTNSPVNGGDFDSDSVVRDICMEVQE